MDEFKDMQSQATFTIVDEKGQISRIKVHLVHLEIHEIREWLGSPVDFARQLGKCIDHYISGKIQSINLTIPVDLPSGIKRIPESTSDVEEGLRIIYDTKIHTTWQHRIPTFREDFILPNGDIDWQYETDVNFIEMMTIPEELSADWGVYPVDARGDLIREALLCKKSFKSR